VTNPDPLFARWSEIDTLFDAALSRPPDERLAFLRTACGSDESLFGVVAELIAASDDAPGLLEDRTLIITRQGMLDDAGIDTATRAEIGQRIGPYRLVSALGRGGTGTVYHAERVDGAFDQQVAIKLLRRGLDTEDVLSRFRAERQILASLDHANIARLFGGGALADGRPYLVMELVEGTPITEYCDAARLTIEQRLRLFVDVARAVEYAHRNLVVHRDLKPSNILVTADGTVKLLDFGIAKLLDSGVTAAGAEPHTHTGVRMLTPDYASPEQLRGEPISTASDTYQLGVLLCRLLTGARPHATDGWSAVEMARAAAGVPPQPPSVLAARAPREGTDRHKPVDIGDFAAACRSDPKRLRRRLRGDLDTIVLTALHAEPERRYASVAAFAADIEHHLAGRPVTARPDGRIYRSRKWVQRHPGWTTALLVSLLAAAAYLATSIQHAGRLTAERDRALIESAKLQQLSDFLLALFEAADPDNADGEQLSAVELLRRGEARADALDGDPALKAQMLSTIGSLYTRLGEYDRAGPLLDEALRLQRATGVGGEADLVRTLNRMGNNLHFLGRADEAEPLLHEAVEVAAATGDAALEADGYSLLGSTLHRRGDHRGAEPMYRRALALRRQVFGEHHERTADGLYNLALTLHMMGRTNEAQSLFEAALVQQRALLHAEHSSLAATLSALGRLHAWKGEYAMAEPLLRDAVGINRARLGPRHPQLRYDLGELGLALMHAGQHAEAESLLREALSITLETLGETHSLVAVSLGNVAFALAEQGRIPEAISLRRRALEITRLNWGADHPNTALHAYQIGALQERNGEHVAAEAELRGALDIYDAAVAAGHPLNARAQTLRGELLTRFGRAAEAEPLLRHALARRQASQQSAVSVGELESLLGACLAALGQLEEAEQLLRSGRDGLQEEHGADHQLTIDARRRLTEFEARRGG
jgi:serine/threonine-protein kinase